jgi:DNA polymerase elongation subunit (family B)
MSPETKRGSVLNWDTLEFDDDPKYEVEITRKGRLTLNKAEFKRFCWEHSLVCSGAGILFSQAQSGVVSDFVKHVFEKKQGEDRKKKELKKELSDLPVDNDSHSMEMEAIEREISKCELGRSLWKVLANSIYGVVSNNVSPLYDLDIARSVTLTGQRVIQKGYEIVRDYSRDQFGVNVDENDLIVASDTDSMMVTFTPILERLGEFELFEDEKLSDKGRKLLELYQKKINSEINKWAKGTMFTNKNIYNFEREKVCPAALFLAKKNYAYHVLNNEGADCNVVKYTGLRTVKSEYSEFAKDLLDDIYTYILKNYKNKGDAETRRGVVELARHGKTLFLNASNDHISKRQKANNIQKYVVEGAPVGEFAKGCPAQTRAAHWFNTMIKEKGLTGKYPPIASGDKVKWAYVKKNPFGIPYVAYLDEFPTEFGLEIDAEVQYEKIIGSAIDKVFEVLKWREPHLDVTDAGDLWEMFI